MAQGRVLFAVFFLVAEFEFIYKVLEFDASRIPKGPVLSLMVFHKLSNEPKRNLASVW